MLIAALNVWNEQRLLPGCLESIWGQVDRIVVVDGRYQEFPGDSGPSDDLTVAIARAYGAEVIGCPAAGWNGQTEKRSAYFVGEDGDWYLIIDADERLIGTVPALADGAHYALHICNRWGRPGWSPRIVQHRGWMRYEGSHNALWRGEELISLKGAVQIDPGVCKLQHLAHLREAERIDAKQRYYNLVTRNERAYRRRYGI